MTQHLSTSFVVCSLMILYFISHPAYLSFIIENALARETRVTKDIIDTKRISAIQTSKESERQVNGYLG